MLGYVSYHLRRIPYSYCLVWNAARDHAARSNDAASTNGHAW